MNPATLPDLNLLPSVLETHEVDSVLKQAIVAAESNPDLPPQKVIDCVVDAIFARGYRPGEEFDAIVSGRILDWIKNHWDTETPEFIDAASTVLANLNHASIDPFLELMNTTERREFARKSIAEAQSARIEPANKPWDATGDNVPC
jgi:hypothetical protein